MELISQPTTGNNALSIVWSITANKYASIDSHTGLVTVHTLPSAGLEPTATVTCTLTRLNGSIITATMTVMFYQPDAKFGDYVYHDGTYSTVLNTSKDVVGMVVDVDETGKHGTIVSLGYFKFLGLVEARSDGRSNPIYSSIDPSLTNHPTLDGVEDGILFDSTNYSALKQILVDDAGQFIQHSLGALSESGYEVSTKIYNVARKRVADLGRAFPTTKSELEEYITAYPNDYKNCCPMVVDAYLYEPVISSTNSLYHTFKQGQWRVAGMKELLRTAYACLENYDIYQKGILKCGIGTSMYLSITLVTGAYGAQNLYYIGGVSGAGGKYGASVVDPISNTTNCMYIAKF